SLGHHRCAVSHADRADGEPYAQERPYAARFNQEPQCGERADGNQGPAGARPQAQIARWMRAGGQRDRTLALGADRGPLRVLSPPLLPFRPRSLLPCPAAPWSTAMHVAVEWPSNQKAAAVPAPRHGTFEIPAAYRWRPAMEAARFSSGTVAA